MGEDSELVVVTDLALDAFERQFRARATFDVDQELAADLRVEARPAAEALHFALNMETADDDISLDHHEGMAMISLLARRAALLGATPMGALGLVPSLLDALTEGGAPSVSARYGSMLEVACHEGFVRGREEKLRAQIAHDAASAIPTLKVSAGVLALVLSGDHEADVLQRRGAEFARELFAREATGCVIDVSKLLSADRSRGAAVLETVETALTIGASCAVSGVDETWREILDALEGSAGVPLYADFERALEHVLRDSGHVIKARLNVRIKRLLGL